MKRIYVPTRSASEWQLLLAKPSLHWKKSFSAMTTAACWEAADGELPPEVRKVLSSSGTPQLKDLDLIAAMPEWSVPLPGGSRASFTDVLALARNDLGLVVIGVEAKVDEEFGPTLRDKRAEQSEGQTARLSHLQRVLKLDDQLEDDIRYQLLHRTAAALATAEQFHASSAVMLVQSFSKTARWQGDFLAFCGAMNAEALSPELFQVRRFEQPALYLAWCAGDQKFLDTALQDAEPSLSPQS